MKHRQKVIKLADQSELGWRLVAEYESNPVASDSDDEKRIFKAEARASRKIKAERGAKRGRWRGYPYRRYARGRSDNNQNETVAITSQQPKRPGLCFSCNSPGHWKLECPALKATNSNNKISMVSSVLGTSYNKCSDLGKEEFCIEIIVDELDTKEVGNVDNISPVGRLKGSIEKWKEVTDDLFITGVIQDGYKLPLKSYPPSKMLRNNKSARNDMKFVQEEVQRLLSKGIVTEVSHMPHVVNPLTVAYSKSGKPRLVLDCHHINQYLHLFKFKYEDIKVAELMFRKGFFLFTFDLKSAYHHIDIFTGHRQYLGFSVQYDRMKKRLRVQFLTIWGSLCGTYLFKSIKGRSEVLAVKGAQNNNVLR